MQAKSDPPEVEGDPNAVVLVAILVLIVAGMIALAWLLTVLLSTFEAVSSG